LNVARVKIESGVCGYVTHVRASKKGKRQVELCIDSTCPDIMRLAAEIPEVDPYKELTTRGCGSTRIINAGLTYCAHAACPVPAGIVKAMEVAAGFALPRNAVIEVSADE
jgi:hypothetical protein